jgi:Fic-DOC domain mobile mystery protein B
MMKFSYSVGQTPIDAVEKMGLIPFITNQAELNILEEENIIEAADWLFEGSVLKKHDLFTEKFLLELHKRMYKDVWKWAGQFRKTEKNIGVEPYKIRIELKQLLDDAKYWLEHNTYPIFDLAIIFHHRLVKIHLFPNGNGRHARLCADAIVKKYNGGEIGWSRNVSLLKECEIRKKYISALREADKGNYADLINFAKSEG